VIEKYDLPDLRPFKDVYTGVDRTANRAITEKEIYLIMHIDTGDDHALTLARDLFTFSYLLRGMTFVDMAFLRKSDIKGDTVTYRRKKTQVLLRARLEPEAREIIRKYRKETENSIYIFPILGGRTDEAAYGRYRSALTVYNRCLKALASRAGISTSLSSYVSRHSWASAAYRSDVPMCIIGESLGHRSEQTTRIYLASIDQRRIDDVNHRIIGRIKKFCSSLEANRQHKKRSLNHLRD